MLAEKLINSVQLEIEQLETKTRRLDEFTKQKSRQIEELQTAIQEGHQALEANKRTRVDLDIQILQTREQLRVLEGSNESHRRELQELARDSEGQQMRLEADVQRARQSHNAAVSCAQSYRDLTEKLKATAQAALSPERWALVQPAFASLAIEHELANAKVQFMKEFIPKYEEQERAEKELREAHAN